MRFLQASDFHLHPEHPERLDALAAVVRRAVEERADVLLVPGDLFDAPWAADVMRADVRRALQGFTGQVLVVPGNHDVDRSSGTTAFPSGADYGSRTTVLDGAPYARIDLPDPRGALTVVGVPFRHEGTLGRDLAGLETDPLRSVLLAHGTFQTEWVAQLAAGEGEEAGAYYPIRRADLEGRFAYAALGHFHSATTFDDWTAEAAWGYAGSPVSISRAETGPRHAVVVDFTPGVGVVELRRSRLDTPYWEECRVTGEPREMPAELLERLRARICERFSGADARRGLHVAVDGWIDGSEIDVREGVDRLVSELSAAHRTVTSEVAVTAAAQLLESQPWLSDLLDRARRIGGERGADDEVLRLATDLLIQAAAERR